MVMKIEPIFEIIQRLKSQRDYDEIIYLTPDGQVFDQPMANRLSLKSNLILLCGHYKGIDERIRTHLITMEISIGSFVLSGAELASAVVVDAIARLIPGVGERLLFARHMRVDDATFSIFAFIDLACPGNRRE